MTDILFMPVLVGGVGIEPTLTALSGQCLRVYKARPKANISNPPNIFIVKHRGYTNLGVQCFCATAEIIQLGSGNYHPGRMLP